MPNSELRVADAELEPSVSRVSRSTTPSAVKNGVSPKPSAPKGFMSIFGCFKRHQPPRKVELSKIECKLEYRDIFDAAEAGNVKDVLRLHKDPFANKMPLGYYRGDLSKELVTPLVVLGQSINKARSANKKLFKSIGMSPKLANRFIELITLYEDQPVGEDGIHPLYRGGIKSLLECFTKIHSSWGKTDTEFHRVWAHYLSAGVRVARRTGTMTTTESSENIASKCDSLSPTITMASISSSSGANSLSSNGSDSDTPTSVQVSSDSSTAGTFTPKPQLSQ